MQNNYQTVKFIENCVRIFFIENLILYKFDSMHFYCIFDSLNKILN